MNAQEENTYDELKSCVAHLIVSILRRDFLPNDIHFKRKTSSFDKRFQILFKLYYYYSLYLDISLTHLSFQPSNSSSTSSIFSNLQLPLSFAPSLTTPSASGSESTCFDSNGLDSTLQPLPFSPSRYHSSSDVFLSSASQFGPIGTRPPSAKSSASTDEGIHMGSGDGNTTIENGSELLFYKNC